MMTAQHAADLKTIQDHRDAGLEFPIFSWKEGESMVHNEAEAIRAMPKPIAQRTKHASVRDELDAIWTALEAN